MQASPELTVLQQVQNMAAATAQEPMALAAIVYALVAVLLQLLGISWAVAIALGSAFCSLAAVYRQQQTPQQQQAGLAQHQQSEVAGGVTESSGSGLSVSGSKQSSITITILRADIISGEIQGTDLSAEVCLYNHYHAHLLLCAISSGRV